MNGASKKAAKNAAMKARHKNLKSPIRDRSQRSGVNAPVEKPKSSFIFPTKHMNTFMAPFLAYVRLFNDDDRHQTCMDYIRDITSYKPDQQLVVGYTGFYSVFTRDAKSIALIRQCLFLNQRFRWNMKRLIYRWRISKCRQVNTEDIFTCETPVKLIEIYDWPQRSKYVFEASTVYRDYLTKIQNTSGNFVVPMMPRNPFTNAELTYGQLHFTIRALIQCGYNHWSFDAFKKSDYTMQTFLQVYEQPLKYDNLKNIYRKPTEDYCVELVYDCIENEYNYHGVEMPYKYGWKLALREHSDYRIIQAWRALSLKEEQLHIRYDGAMLDYKMIDIHAASLELISRPTTEITKVYRKWLDEEVAAEIAADAIEAAAEEAAAAAAAAAEPSGEHPLEALHTALNNTYVFTIDYIPYSFTPN